MEDQTERQAKAWTQLKEPSQIPKVTDSISSDVLLECPEMAECRSIENILCELPVEARTRFEHIYTRFQNSLGSDLPTVEKAIEDYFSMMVDFLESAEQQQILGSVGETDYIHAVEELYLMNCVRNRNTNTYLISSKNPVRVMNKELDSAYDRLLQKCLDDMPSSEESKQEADNLSDAATHMAYDVLKEIFDIKKKNRQQIRLYCRNQVYETLPEKQNSDGQEEWVSAYPFNQIRSNTEIPYLRIWEKLDSYRKRFKKDTIKVAVFGKLQGEDEYAKEKSLLGDNVKVDWISFEGIPSMGEYYFQNVKGRDKQFYDLSNIADVIELVHKYNIILFFDLNCFYRQYQTEKTVEERNEGINCRWYLDRSREQSAFKDKAVYYQNIYLHVGKWLNSLRETHSSSYEFDINLYRNLMNASDEKTDIYLYIKDSNKIASYNLEYSGVCNDEYYSGKTLLVYKLTKTNIGDFNRNYQDFLNQTKEESESFVKVKLWKLLKSINNNYCNRVLELICNEKNITCGNLIKALDCSFLILQYTVKASESQINIGFDVSLAEQLDQKEEIKKLLQELARVVLYYAQGNENIHCIRKYFKDLLINSIITNAKSIKDLVFAYIWSQPWMKWSFEGKTLSIIQQGDSEIEGKHKLYKTIYVLIERLDNLRMRSVPDIQGYLLDVFRKIVSPEVQELSFKETLQYIAKYCKEFGYTSSSLYLNSTLIDHKEKASE